MRNQSLQTQNDLSLDNSPSLLVAYPLPQEEEQIKSNPSNAVTEPLPGAQWITDYFDNDYSIAVSVLEIFIEEMIPAVSELGMLLNKQGADEVRKKAHKINPSFKMIGQSSLAAALKDLENDCSAGEDISNLHLKIKTIQDQTEKVTPFILKQYYTISKLAH